MASQPGIKDKARLEVLEYYGTGKVACVRCGELGDVVHHRDTNKRNNSPMNLEVLCYKCHSRCHGNIRMNDELITALRYRG